MPCSQTCRYLLPLRGPRCAPGRPRFPPALPTRDTRSALEPAPAPRPLARSRPGCGWGGERRGEAGGGAERSFLRRFLPPPRPPPPPLRECGARGGGGRHRRGAPGPSCAAGGGGRSRILRRGPSVGPGRSAPPWRRPGPRPAEPRPGGAGRARGAGWGRREGLCPAVAPGRAGRPSPLPAAPATALSAASPAGLVAKCVRLVLGCQRRAAGGDRPLSVWSRLALPKHESGSAGPPP